MLKMFGVAATDQLNRYNNRFTVGSLSKGLYDNWNKGVPSYINHDHTKPIGWNYFNSLYFEPGLVRATNVMIIADNDKEYEIMTNKIQAFHINEINEKHKDKLESFKEKLSETLSSDYKFHLNESLQIFDEGIVERVFPDLFLEGDKKGLICIEKLEKVQPGVYCIGEFLVFADRLFRRSFSYFNTFNVEFLEKFELLSEDKNMKTKISIDRNLIGLKGTERLIYEYQYWWGPKFSDSIEDIQYGETRYENSNYEEAFNGIQNTDFLWHRQDDIRTFECEELVDVPNLEEDRTGCRYVHSMVNKDGRPYHLDGAIRVYSFDKILERIDVKFSDSGKDTEYIKLWRIDGDIQIDKWKELITHFYRDNRLIGEYFNGVDEVDVFKPELLESETKKNEFNKQIPYNMNKGDGVRIALSYKNLPSVPSKKDIVIRPNMSIRNKDKSFSRCVESDTYELIKLLKKQNIFVHDPLPTTKILEYDDMVLNLPSIILNGKGAVNNANVVNETILMLCNQWIKLRQDRLLSYTMNIDFGDRYLVISIAGNIFDIQDWLKDNSSKMNHNDINEWCENLKKYLEKYGDKRDTPPLNEIYNDSGSIYFKRVFIDDCKLEKDVNKKGIVAEVKIQKANTELYKLIEDEIISLSLMHNNIEVKCSNCGKEYYECLCSKYFDDNTTAIIKRFEPCGAFWTNRDVKIKKGIIK